LFVLALIVFALSALIGAISLLGILYPFRPFGTRKRAALSLVGCLVLLIGSTIAASTLQPPPAPLTTASNEAPAPAPAPEPIPAPAPATAPAPAPDPAPAADKFPASAFMWDADTKKYKKQIIAVVNRIARENTNCPNPDPTSVTLSTDRSKPNDPVFFVMCGSGLKVFNVWFRPADADKTATMAGVKPISQSGAVSACEATAKAAANHPSTVDFSRFMDAAYVTYPSGRARLTSSFTAKNSFGLDLTYDIQCLFEGTKLIETVINERN